MARLEAGHLLARHALALALFDQSEMGLGGGAVGADEADRQAAFTGAAGAADAVHVGLWGAREVKVDDHRQLIDVQAARGQIGGDQHLQVAGLEVGQRHLARALAHLAMQRGRGNAEPGQLAGDMLAGVAGRHKHQHPTPAVVLDQVAQQLGAARGIDLDRALLDGCHVFGRAQFGHVNAQGLAQQGLRQRVNGGREGGREQQALARRRQLREQARQLVGKTGVEQAVGLVEHQCGDIAQAQRVALDQVEQPARRGHHHLGAAAQRHHLRVDRDAAVDDQHLDRLGQLPRQRAQRFTDLGRQLARGHQHQRQRAARRGARAALDVLQQRQSKGRGLARAGLRRGQHVAASQQRRDRRGLDRRGLGVAQRGGGAQQRGREAEGVERHQRLRSDRRG